MCTPPLLSAAARWLAALASLALLLPAVQVGADQFQPEGDPPAVGVPVLSVQDAAPETFAQFEPADPTSDDAYFLDVTIGTPSLTTSLEQVVVCLYLPGVHGPEDVTDPACDPDTYERSDDPLTLDPQTMLVMVWDRIGAGTDQDGTFRMVGDNQHALHPLADGVPSWGSGWVDGSALALDLRFGFRVSGAMRHANDWALRIDAAAGPVGTQVVGNLAVAYFGSITTDRPVINFGPVRSGVPVDRVAPAGRYRANSRVQQTISSSALEFVTPGGPTIALPLIVVGGGASRGIGSGQGAAAPGPNQATLDCSDGDTFDDAMSVRVDTVAQTFRTGLPPVGEAEQETGDHTCRIQYGGGIDRANVALANTIEVAVSADEPRPRNLVVTESGTSATLAWDAPVGATGEDPDVTVRTYVVEVGDAAGTAFDVALDVDGDTTTAVLTGLTRSTLYTYRVTANTNVGAGSVDTAPGPQVPTAPPSVTAAGSTTGITVSWVAPSDDGGAAITEYRVIARDASSLTEVAQLSRDGSATTATFLSGSGAGQLAAGTDFVFEIVAVNEAGDSAASAPSGAAQISAAIQQTFTAGTGRTGSFQTFTVPATQDYVLELDGAQGGGASGGRGARITATFALNEGDVLRIMAGHRGAATTGAAGGGGASAVWRQAGGSGAFELLAIAGGGGGVTSGTAATTAHASTGANGNGGSATFSWFLAQGGVAGQSGGGTSGFGGAGGGGGVGDGRPLRDDNRNAAKITPTQAAGGTNGAVTGGFGGGGAANNNGTTFLGGGGGGGFSGGGGASSSSGAAANGGGGGSWVAGSRVSQSIVSGASSGNTGAGSVTVRTP